MTEAKALALLVGQQLVITALIEATLDDPTAISEHRDLFQTATDQLSSDETYYGICNTLNRLLNNLPHALTTMPGTRENDPNGRTFLFRHAPPTTVDAARILTLLSEEPDPARLAQELVDGFFLQDRTGPPFEAAVALLRMNLERHASAPTPGWKRWHVIAQITASALHDVTFPKPGEGDTRDDDRR